MEPDWENIYMWETDSIIGVEVKARLTRPVNYATIVEKSGDTVSQTLQQPEVWILFNECKETGETICFLASLLPDESYCGDPALIGSNPERSNYWGIAIYSEVDGTPLLGRRFENGEIVGTLVFDEQYREWDDPDINIGIGIIIARNTRTDEEDDPIDGGSIPIITITAKKVVIITPDFDFFVPPTDWPNPFEDDSGNDRGGGSSGGSGGSGETGGTGGPTPPTTSDPEQTYDEKINSLVEILKNAIAISITRVGDRFVVEVVASLDGTMAQFTVTLDQMFDSSTVFTLNILEGLTDTQLKLVLSHEILGHLTLFDIMQLAGSASNLVEHNQELLSLMNVYGVNDGQHKYWANHIDEFEQMMRNVLFRDSPNLFTNTANGVADSPTQTHSKRCQEVSEGQLADI